MLLGERAGYVRLRQYLDSLRRKNKLDCKRCYNFPQ